MDIGFLADGLAFLWWEHDNDAKVQAQKEAASAKATIDAARNATAPMAWAAVSDEFKDE